ncbi:MAG: c-type cytochrome biogenesis protein CcsB [Armatimonadota bacterium]
MEHIAAFITITAIIYGFAAVLYLWSLLGGTEPTRRIASVLMALGLLTHTVSMVYLGISLRRAPLINLYESLMFFAWAMVAVYLVVGRKHRIPALGAFVAPLSLCIVVFASTLPRGISTSLQPALKSQWSVIHVSSSLLSYASFVLAFGAAVVYVIQEHMLKAKRITGLQKRLPPLHVADRLAYKLVSFGFPMLTLGIVTGSLWAQSAWNSYWSWDPKETWSLITWLVYAIYLHVRIVSRWQGKWANRLLIAGFICIITTFFGVNFLGSGLHKYNW